MDLYAYAQIDNLEHILKENSIEIPRLRGIRLMSEENQISKEEIDVILHAIEIDICKEACQSIPRFRPDNAILEWSSATRRLLKKYMIVDGTEYVGFRWELLHGKNKKAVKYSVKRKQRQALKCIEAQNKYAGREDVICVHARIGGNNWNYYGGNEIAKQPWFLDKADDLWDSTYCNIYCRVEGHT